MLSSEEKLVLKVLNDNCGKRNACIISPENVVAFVGREKLVNVENLGKILSDLEYEDYLDAVFCYRDETPFYCVRMHKKGKNYVLENKKQFRELRNRILIAVVCACVSFIVGRILILVFS